MDFTYVRMYINDKEIYIHTIHTHVHTHVHSYVHT